MKPIRYLLATTVIFFAVSCNNEKKDTETTVVQQDTVVPVTTVAQTALTEGTSVTITTEQVPDSMEMSFKTKYPKALTPQWVRYTPIPADNMMDTSYYYVRFVNNGEDITSWYDNSGQWVKTSTKVKGDYRLPDAVNKTLNAQYPGYKIEEIDKENDKDMDMYEIKLNKGDEKAKLKILPNGEIFKRK